MSVIEIEVRTGVVALAAEWRALSKLASPNVFMDPAALSAVHESGIERPVTLLAWEKGDAGRTLVGLWALAEKTISPLGPSFLSSPPHHFATVSSPVINPTKIEAVIAAFLKKIATDPGLPKVVRMKYLDGDCPADVALTEATTRGRSRVLSTRTRAFMERTSGPKRSGSTRKKLRQFWNRLSAEGAVDVVIERVPEAVKVAFEAFLELEKKSWKGEGGTALLSHAGHARFARGMIANLAAEGNASVALLRLNGKPIAAQVLLYSGSLAYTWKIAHDSAYDRHSPGMLLVDKVTEQLFESAGIEGIESCSPEGGFMTSLWPGRRRTVDLLVDLGGRRSVTFDLVALAVRAYAEAKAMRRRFYAWRAGKQTAPPPAVAEPVPNTANVAAATQEAA
jgi:hypothetical protein